MAAQLLKFLLKQQIYLTRKRKKNSGFTILELLVASLIATMVVIALLDMVVDLLQSDRREYARNETQREMQMSLDYMVNDIREAAYVYNQDELNGANNVSQFLSLPAGFKPILAFWKPETLADDKLSALGNCSQFAVGTSNRSECEQLIVRRRALSLVVYLQKENTPQERQQEWKGISRIARFQLNKYKQTPNAIRDLDKTNGYVDPQENTVSFASWPYIATRGSTVAPGANAGGAQGTTQVLVDFVDFPTTARTDNLTAPQTPVCPGTNYSRIPTDSVFNKPSFMVCVSTNNTSGSGADLSNTNQDVLLFLRGNPTGKAGVRVAPLLAVRTQAVARGVVNKQPQ